MKNNDRVKLLEEGWTILRAGETGVPAILMFDYMLSEGGERTSSVMWKTLATYSCAAARDRAMRQLLEDQKTIEDE